MATYKVQAGDTPASIAQKLTGNPYNGPALIAANPQKAKMIDNGSLTFRSMKQNELLAVPPNWLGYTDSSPKVFPKNSPSPGNAIISVQGVGRVGRFGLGDPNSDGTAAALIAAYNADAGLTICNDASGNGNATVLAFQQSYNGSTTGQKLDEDGKYGPNTQTALQTTLSGAGGPGGTAPTDCTNYTAPSPVMATAPDLGIIAAEVAGDFTLCNGYNANVAAFQDAYNAATPGASLGVSQDYGFYTAATATALASLPAAMALPSYLTAPPACTNFPNPAGPGSGGAPYVPPTPTPPTPGTTTTTTSSSSNTPLIIGLVLAAAAVGTYAYLHQKKHGSSSMTPQLGPHRALARRSR